MEFESSISDSPQLWLFPVLAIILGLVAVRLKSKVSLHVIAISLLYYIAYSIHWVLSDHINYSELLLSLGGGSYLTTALLFALLPKTFLVRNIFIFWSILASLIASFSLQFIIDDLYSDFDQVQQLWAVITITLMLGISALAALLWRKEIVNLTFSVLIIVGAALVLFLPIITIVPGDIAAQMLYGAGFFAVCVILLIHGAKTEQNYQVWIGGVGFTAQALYVYFETFKDLLNTSLFFLIGGLILLVLSVIALRLAKKPKQPIENQQAAS
jgi:uncharacterized membrane protein